MVIPGVTVVIPSHNAERWIEGALGSVFAQTQPCREILVIDDVSTDRTVEVVEKMRDRAAGLTEFRILKVDCRNAAMTRNRGIEAATSSWTALLDADDLWHPEHIERAMKILAPSSDVAFMANHEWIGLDHERVEMPPEFRCRISESTAGMDCQAFCRVMLEGYHFCHSSVIYRTDVLRAVGGFDETQVRRHDIELWLRMLAAGTWAYDTEDSARYRINTPGSISRSELECDAYYLKALLKNKESFPFPEYASYLQKQARRAMGIAVTAGDPDHLRRIRPLALEAMSGKLRFVYGVGLLFPNVLARLLRGKRALSRGKAVDP